MREKKQYWKYTIFALHHNFGRQWMRVCAISHDCSSLCCPTVYIGSLWMFCVNRTDVCTLHRVVVVCLLKCKQCIPKRIRQVLNNWIAHLEKTKVSIIFYTLFLYIVNVFLKAWMKLTSCSWKWGFCPKSNVPGCQFCLPLPFIYNIFILI